MWGAIFDGTTPIQTVLVEGKQLRANREEDPGGGGGGGERRTYTGPDLDLGVRLGAEGVQHLLDVLLTLLFDCRKVTQTGSSRVAVRLFRSGLHLVDAHHCTFHLKQLGAVADDVVDDVAALVLALLQHAFVDDLQLAHVAVLVALEDEVRLLV